MKASFILFAAPKAPWAQSDKLLWTQIFKPLTDLRAYRSALGNKPNSSKAFPLPTLAHSSFIQSFSTCLFDVQGFCIRLCLRKDFVDYKCFQITALDLTKWIKELACTSPCYCLTRQPYCLNGACHLPQKKLLSGPECVQRGDASGTVVQDVHLYSSDTKRRTNY